MHPVKDLKVYQKAFLLSILVYRYSKQFPKEEIFGLTSQMRRCAVSIPSNIAEGKGRYSDKDYARFLSISRGSLFELQTQADIALELGYINSQQHIEITQLSDEIGRMLTAMIRKIS